MGAVLLAGAGPLSRRVVGPAAAGSLGLRLAGVRDLAFGIAMARSASQTDPDWRTWAWAAQAIQVGDLAVFLLLRRQGRVGWALVAGVGMGAAATWRLLRS